MNRLPTILAGLLAGGLVALAAAAPDQDATMRVAVVNIREIFQDTSIPQIAEARATLEAFIQPRQSRIDEIEAQIEQLRQSLRSAPANSALAEETQSQLRQRLAEHQVYANFYQQEVMLREVELNLRLYQAIRNASAEVARARGCDLVLRTAELPSREEERQPSREELLRQMRDRVVLYADERVDITRLVAEQMRRSR